MRTIASAWHGAYLIDGTTILREARAPLEMDALVDGERRRLSGTTTEEEERLLATRGEERWSTRDRRLVREGIVYDRSAPGPPEVAVDPTIHRSALLRQAERALEQAWDPSVHVEEAVRALRDLDRAANLLGERLTSWAARDVPELEGQAPLSVAQALLDRPETPTSPREDPTALRARRQLAELQLHLAQVRSAVDGAVRASVPVHAPNLNHLLGPELAARLVAQAGGLDRLAHLPASTVQVLGAERAFFEHLRGRAPPPRYGLLFLHAAIQSAPRAQRGKLARALAAKVAIAARLDRAGAPVNEALARAFEARRTAIRASRPGAPRKRPPARLRPPLHGAAGDG